MKKTPLHQHHVDLGAKMMEFAQFDMPIVYSDITKEHQAVREDVGIFDVSHMGEILIEGPDALRLTNHLVTNAIADDTSKVTYCLLCNEQGYVIDDLLVYVIRTDLVLLVVNASNIAKDIQWVETQSKGFDVTVKDISDDYSQIAIQGPNAVKLIDALINSTVSDLTFMTHRVVPYKEGHIIVSRTGYTGEDGFEIYGDHPLIIELWEQALKLGVTPCGLGARDTLRFEANLPLYGHEIDDTITPLEAGLGFAVKLDKNFIGRDALVEQKDQLTRKIVGIELLEKGIPRQGYELMDANQAIIGHITTGYLSPTLQKPIALAMIDINHALMGHEVVVLIRNKQIPAKIISRRFLQKNYKK